MNNSKASENQLEDGHLSSQSQDAFDQLKTLLREMFQLDRGDLDFGLYRIMKMKNNEIEAFLDNDLLPQVKVAIAAFTDEERARVKAELDDAIKQLKHLKAPIDNNETVRKLRAQLVKVRADVSAEADAYNLLTNFFARYYDEGDFVSLRRYSSGGHTTYAIPYNGEEVKLHWANADQFYIKTTENYSTYAFFAGNSQDILRVRFEVAKADNERDNVKEVDSKQRRFVLSESKIAVALDGDDLVISFEHRPLTESERKTWSGTGNRQQKRINDEVAAQILSKLEILAPEWRKLLSALAPTEAAPQRTVLEKHIERFTAKNSFDYFIHKDLSGFLHRELDFYLKNEVLNLDELTLEDADRIHHALTRMRATRHLGEKIIDFLAQLEDFQKRLWLKKKFVLETQWCVTLDRIPPEIYPEVSANVAQREEWVRLFAIDEITGAVGENRSSYSEPLSVEFLIANPHMVLDTRHFNSEFKDHLLAVLSDAGPLDGQTDGVLIHGENFQALDLLQARYGGQLNCIYVDPPYNTENDEFLYKDRFKHSSWLSMMMDRIQLASRLLAPHGTFFASIDHNEISALKAVLDKIFDRNFEGLITWRRRYNQPNDRTKMIGLVAEYLLAYAKDPVALRRSGVGKIDLTSKYSNPDNDPRGEWATKPWKSGSGQSGTRYKIKSPTGTLLDEEWMGSENTYRTLLDDDRIVFPSRGNGMPRKKYFRFEREIEGQCATNWWSHEHFGNNAGASDKLYELFGCKNLFNNPKPVELIRGVLQVAGRTVDVVLDFFAGSGTTGHAVIELNREDGSKRKYLLVEMADYFNSVLLPRIKKAIYAPDWKSGKPVSREKGVTQLVKCVRLESYEDTLDCLVLTSITNDLLENTSLLEEDYKLRYALRAETADSACLLGRDFADPFSYTLSAARRWSSA